MNNQKRVQANNNASTAEKQKVTKLEVKFRSYISGVTEGIADNVDPAARLPPQTEVATCS